jgi:predicted small secreted protein
MAQWHGFCREGNMKKIFMLTMCAFALAGCNTMEGLGKDIKTAGEKVESAAKR